jgi:hypothetical protein
VLGWGGGSRVGGGAKGEGLLPCIDGLYERLQASHRDLGVMAERRHLLPQQQGQLGEQAETENTETQTELKHLHSKTDPSLLSLNCTKDPCPQNNPTPSTLSQIPKFANY